jgi:hypothetical protein
LVILYHGDERVTATSECAGRLPVGSDLDRHD